VCYLVFGVSARVTVTVGWSDCDSLYLVLGNSGFLPAIVGLLLVPVVPVQVRELPRTQCNGSHFIICRTIPDNPSPLCLTVRST
jgi:hypothetical protein